MDGDRYPDVSRTKKGRCLSQWVARDVLSGCISPSAGFIPPRDFIYGNLIWVVNEIAWRIILPRYKRGPLNQPY